MGTKQYDSATDLITFSRASGGTFLGSNGLLQTAANNVPRIEYDATGAVKGLLIEEARTNLLTHSNDFTNAVWIKTAASNTANAGVSPDGTSNANKVVPATNAGVHYTYQTLSLPSTDHSFSVYVASSGYGFATICAGSIGTADYYAVVIDLSDGTQTALYSQGSHSKTVTVEPVGSYYRVTISGNRELYYVVGASDTGTYTPSNYGFKSFSGDGTSGILVYGAQAEAGSFPTSYIPTSGASATRSRDLAEIPTSAFGYNNVKGSLVIDVLTPVADQFMVLAYFNTGSYFNSRGFSKSNLNNSSVGTYYIFAAYDGSSNTKLALTQQTQAVYAKLGLSYGDSERAVRDGGTVLSGNSRSTNPSRLHLGGRENGYDDQCWVKSIQYYPRQLTDTQLQELTT